MSSISDLSARCAQRRAKNPITYGVYRSPELTYREREPIKALEDAFAECERQAPRAVRAVIKNHAASFLRDPGLLSATVLHGLRLNPDYLNGVEGLIDRERALWSRTDAQRERLCRYLGARLALRYVRRWEYRRKVMNAERDAEVLRREALARGYFQVAAE